MEAKYPSSNDPGLERHCERFWRRYEAGEWERHTKILIEETLQPGDLFLDIGAWIGPVTLWALERGASVIAVEPDPLALKELLRRVPASVEIWEGAVGVKSGSTGLTTRKGGRFGRSMSYLDEEGEIQVQTWTLPEILAGRVPALVKIDIEGYEIALLPEIAPFLAAAGVPMQVALHGVLPERDWFAGYHDVRIPSNPRGTVVAKP
jgi:FkbM family methyltransferase